MSDVTLKDLKVGMRVRFYSFEYLEELYGLNAGGDIQPPEGVSILSGMVRYLGEVHTITQVEGCEFTIDDGDSTPWYWQPYVVAHILPENEEEAGEAEEVKSVEEWVSKPTPEEIAELKEELEPLIGIKHDDGKLPWSLLPLEAIEPIVKVLAYGAKKYGPNNWQGLEDFETRYQDAFMRHWKDYTCGEEYDPESGMKHLYHCFCNIMFLVWKEIQKEKEG